MTEGARRGISTPQLVANLRQLAPWSGTAADLLALLPDAAPDATRLAKRLNGMAAELGAAGVVIERERQARTGTRRLVLRLAADVALPKMPENGPDQADGIAEDNTNEPMAAGGWLRAAGLSQQPASPTWGSSCGSCQRRAWWRDRGTWRCGACSPPLFRNGVRFVFT
jgi:hypothetical protein